jgi:hypothetical protein
MNAYLNFAREHLVVPGQAGPSAEPFVFVTTLLLVRGVDFRCDGVTVPTLWRP